MEPWSSNSLVSGGSWKSAFERPTLDVWKGPSVAGNDLFTSTNTVAPSTSGVAARVSSSLSGVPAKTSRCETLWMPVERVHTGGL
eukprot:2688845-Prymnesium_polylepis.1